MGIQISDPFRETELKPKLGMQGRGFFQPETGDSAQWLCRTSSFKLQVGFGATKSDLIRSGALQPSVAAQRSIYKSDERRTDACFQSGTSPVTPAFLFNRINSTKENKTIKRLLGK